MVQILFLNEFDHVILNTLCKSKIVNNDLASLNINVIQRKQKLGDYSCLSLQSTGKTVHFASFCRRGTINLVAYFEF